MTFEQHALSSRILFVVVFAVVAAGCATKASDVGSAAKGAATTPLPTSTSSTSTKLPDARPKKAVGDPCVPEDGWQPAPCIKSGDGMYPDMCKTLVGPQSILELPAGVGFCGVKVGETHGYWTVTCREQSDCPTGYACPTAHPGSETAACGTICRSDADCPADLAHSGIGLCPNGGTQWFYPKCMLEFGVGPFCGVLDKCVHIARDGAIVDLPLQPLPEGAPPGPDGGAKM